MSWSVLVKCIFSTYDAVAVRTNLRVVPANVDEQLVDHLPHRTDLCVDPSDHLRITALPLGKHESQSEFADLQDAVSARHGAAAAALPGLLPTTGTEACGDGLRSCLGDDNKPRVDSDAVEAVLQRLLHVRQGTVIEPQRQDAQDVLQVVAVVRQPCTLHTPLQPRYGRWETRVEAVQSRVPTS